MPETDAMNLQATTLIGHLREFDVHNNEWSIFKPRMKNFFEANSIRDDKQKRSVFLNILSEDSYRLLFNLCLPNTPESLTFKDLIEIFNKHFGSQICVFAERLKFYSAVKAPQENMKEWAARVRGLAVHCEFSTELQVMLRDRFIMGLEKGPVRDRLFEETNLISFVDAIRIAISKESFQVKQESSGTPSFSKPENQIFQVRKEITSSNTSPKPTSEDQHAESVAERITQLRNAVTVIVVVTYVIRKVILHLCAQLKVTAKIR